MNIIHEYVNVPLSCETIIKRNPDECNHIDNMGKRVYIIGEEIINNGVIKRLKLQCGLCDKIWYENIDLVAKKEKEEREYFWKFGEGDTRRT